jgi:hypothetical protein
MPVRQYPNRRTVTTGHPGSLGRRIINARNPIRSRNPINGNTGKKFKPTIRGWQNYTGNTMGPVGQFSRVPGFGRKFRG